MHTGPDLDAIVDKARELGELSPRGDRWTHLSLCVLDAVFSMGARYSTTVRTVRTYAEKAGVGVPLAPSDEVAAGRFAADERPLSELVARVEASGGPDGFAAYVDNRQRTSPRGGVLKAEAAAEYAKVLAADGIERLADVPPLLADPSRLHGVETALAKVKGHGHFGVRMSYLWMLSGDDTSVKADRMVLAWLQGPLGRRPPVPEAVSLVSEAADRLHVSPWQLDHAIWQAQRSRR